MLFSISIFPRYYFTFNPKGWQQQKKLRHTKGPNHFDPED